MSSTERARSEARRFGAGAAAVCGLAGAWAAWGRHHAVTGTALGTVGAVLALLGLVAPSAALALRRAWMRIGHALGWVNTRILLGVVFFVLLTPIALAMRLAGRDPLRLRWRPGATPSYWLRRAPTDRQHWERTY